MAQGFELSPPSTDAHTEAFATACAELGADPDLVVAVPQEWVGDRPIDTTDRIQLGAELIRRLVDAGL